MVTNATWSRDGSRDQLYPRRRPSPPRTRTSYRPSGGTPTRLTNSSGPAYLEAALIRPKKVTFPSADGLTIHAYLWEPIVKVGEKAPGILLIHGGPTGQFSDTYQAQAQFFAMHGYAVLAPNIRGSSGYGRAFEDANHGCWGHCDLKDVLAGVAFLRQQPYIDPTRMGITGSSYGGIMSLAASAFAPGLFQASIPISGYGDWPHVVRVAGARATSSTSPTSSAPCRRPIRCIPARCPRSTTSTAFRRPSFSFTAKGAQASPRGRLAAALPTVLEMRYKPYKYQDVPERELLRPESCQCAGNARRHVGIFRPIPEGRQGAIGVAHGRRGGRSGPAP